MLARDELREAFLVRAELESLATEIATPKMSLDGLAALEEAERAFSDATRELVEMSHAGRQDLQLAREVAAREPRLPRRDLRGRRTCRSSSGWRRRRGGRSS